MTDLLVTKLFSLEFKRKCWPRVILILIKGVWQIERNTLNYKYFERCWQLIFKLLSKLNTAPIWESQEEGGTRITGITGNSRIVKILHIPPSPQLLWVALNKVDSTFYILLQHFLLLKNLMSRMSLLKCCSIYYNDFTTPVSLSYYEL